jgi:hypothetical protein
MSCGDSPYGVRRRSVVEQHVAATVDLDVNEARREPHISREFANRDGPWHFSAWNNPGDLVAVDQYRSVPMQSDAVENVARRDGVNA